MRELSFTILKSRNFQRLVITSQTSSKKTIVQTSHHLKQLAQKHGVVSLAANQASSQLSMFVMLQRHLIKPNKWINYKYKSSQYELILNPKILDFSVTEDKTWEQCPSYPQIRFLIKRATHVIVQYEKSFKDKISTREEWKGFQAVIFQHQFTHLKGLNLFDQAEDVDLIEEKNKNFTIAKKDKFKEEFMKFKKQKEDYEGQQKEKQSMIEHSQEDQDEKGIPFTYKRCKNLKNFVDYEIIDPS